MDDYITRAEHDEFCKRLEEENTRQDKRISLLEETVRQMQQLTSSVERLATNMEHMAREQEKQGKRLEALEGRDGEMWRKVLGGVATAVVGALVGFFMARFGIG